jgi:putative DNA methylase
MTQPKKLIEVAMPIKEISSESVRDKSIRHGHISTLHLWWARRPLPVCRAVVFASLVPDPMDENCPQAFRDAVKTLLREHNGMDAYKPYDNIPYTAVVDPMEDNLRNRLLMFIGKFSDTYIQKGDNTVAKDKLSDASLIKWDNKNDEEIIGKARKLIWVAHNAKNGAKADDLLADFDKHYKAIKDAENTLYMTVDRHIESDDVRQKEANLKDAIEAFLDRMPRVFDPFAGGGAIPLEASRLGCRSFGNDINPVAHIIQKGSLEFPQKFGKQITYSKAEFIRLYGEDEYKRVPNENRVFKDGVESAIQITNRLAFDVEFYAKRLLKMAEEEIGHFYPADDKGKKPIAYYWARVGTCSNPSCRAEVPLLKGFYLVNKKDKQVYLKPIIDGNKIDFEIGKGKFDSEGWMTSRALICPCCGSSTGIAEIKRQSNEGNLKPKLIAVIGGSDKGKIYRTPTENEKKVSEVDENLLNLELIPNETMLKIPDLVSGRGWGIDKWSQMFPIRSLLAMQTLISKLNEIKSENGLVNNYGKAITTYLGMFINRIATRQTSFGLWNTIGEKLEHPFGKQAIPMVFDYPESQPFAEVGGAGLNQLAWITRYIESESNYPFSTILQNASSGEKEQFSEKSITAVVTDPPYYDAIAYADLSDFFYVWLKRTLSDVYPANFATPQTPKSEECTALKHHHEGDAKKAVQHFENKLLQIFDAIEHQTSDVVSIMFAHQNTEAWTTLCNSILGARLNITGSWAIDTERSGAGTKKAKAYLASSVTVSCKPANRSGFGDYKQVKAAIEKKVEEEVAELYGLGFRGADLLTACFGKAVGEFGKYERVEKASGDEVTVAELLEMTRESAFNALLKGFKGDDFTKFYIGWLELYGFTESDFDDAAKFSRVGLSINVADLFTHDIFVKNGNKQSLADAVYRNEKIKRLGENADASLIDQAHRAMWLYKGANRRALLDFIGRVAAQPDSTFWRVLTSLDELLPKGMDDQKQVAGLLENKDNLIRESQASRETVEQQGLFS